MRVKKQGLRNSFLAPRASFLLPWKVGISDGAVPLDHSVDHEAWLGRDKLCFKSLVPGPVSAMENCSNDSTDGALTTCGSQGYPVWASGTASRDSLPPVQTLNPLDDRFQ